MENLVSVAEAAEHLGISEQYVRKLLKSGELVGQQVGKSWVIPFDYLDSFRQPKEEKNIEVKNHKRFSGILPNLKCLSFFTGAMGLDIGLERAGITTLLASEIDKSCRKTIEANRPEIGLIGDIRDYTAKQIRDAAALGDKDDIDAIVGGPPCQAFSTAGNRLGFEDERGNVFLKYIDIILELRPKFAVIENVRGLLSAPIQHRPHSQRGKDFDPLSTDELKGGALLHIINLLKKGGYSVSFNLYNSANFGSPQIRERVVILCSRDGEKLPFLTPTHAENGKFGLKPWKTLREILNGLPDMPKDYVKFPEKRLRYYRMLQEGQNWKSLPIELQREALGNSYFAGGGKTGFLRRLAWDKPSPTLVTHPAMPATDLAHPEEDRPLSIQEYKRIQEFPDEWIVCGPLIDQYKQIGNAVPISLGEAIGKALINHLKGISTLNYDDFQYSRYLNTDDASWEKCIRQEINKNDEILSYQPAFQF